MAATGRKVARVRMRTCGVGKSSDSNGFTLLELAIVLLLLTVVLGLVLPEASSLLTDSDLRTSSRRVAGAVAEARNEAMLGGRIWELTIDLEANTFWIAPVGDGEEAGTSAQAGKPEPKRRTLAGEVRFLDVQKGQDQSQNTGRVGIRFHPKGLAEPAAIHLGDQSNRVQTLGIKPFSARLSIQDGYVGGTDGAKG
jgi:prepilin-type N-terminal cleavage/methylation domain-containing protein